MKGIKSLVFKLWLRAYYKTKSNSNYNKTFKNLCKINKLLTKTNFKLNNKNKFLISNLSNIVSNNNNVKLGNKSYHTSSNISNLNPFKQLSFRSFTSLSTQSIINSWFISGFSDAEGSFQILIRKGLRYKLCWSTIAKFRIGLHVKDLELLKSIQLFFNGIGQLEVISTRELAYFEVTKLDDLINIIIPHFDKYPLQSAKSIDYLLWKQCINLMITKEHLTQSGLQQIISIKSAINWGNSELLMNTFSNIKPIERPPYIISEVPLNPHWVSGFCEGDSSFSIYLRPNTNEVQVSFIIYLNEREEPLLIKIQSFFYGIGSINYYNKNSACYYKISNKKQLNDIIMPHFITYELVGNKKSNFLIWSQILCLTNKKAHLTTEGLDKIKFLKDQLNKWN